MSGADTEGDLGIAGYAGTHGLGACESSMVFERLKVSSPGKRKALCRSLGGGGGGCCSAG
jgi:hypothetical protein